MGWLIVVTRPGDEAAAEDALQGLGLECYLPRYRKMLLGARITAEGRRVRARGRHPVLRPLMPGYLFVRRVHDLTEVEATRAATGCRVLHSRRADRSRGAAYVVADEILAAFRADVERGRWDAMDLRPGDTVRVNGGAYTGRVGNILAVDDDTSRAVLLIEFLGRSVKATISAENLAAILPQR